MNQFNTPGKFDVEGFRKEAKANNLTDEEIQSVIDAQPAETTHNTGEVNPVDFLLPALAGGKILTKAVTGELNKISGGAPINERQIVKPETRIEPTFDVPTNPLMDAINKAASGQVNSRQEAEMVGRSENVKAMKSGNVLPFPQLQNPQEVAKEVAPEAPITADTSPQEASTLASVEKAAETPSEAVAEPSKEIPGATRPAISELHKLPGVSPQLAKHLQEQAKTLESNAAFQKAYPKANIGEGQVWLPGLGAMDNTMYTTLGAEGRRHAMEILNEDKPFGSIGAKHNEEAKRLFSEYGKQVSEMTGQDLKGRNQRIAEGLAHTENFGPLGKVMKIGGAVGLLTGINDIANAKSLPEAFARTIDVGTDYVPFVGQAKQGLSPKEAGAPVLPPSILEAQRQATLLGSPYHKFK